MKQQPLAHTDRRWPVKVITHDGATDGGKLNAYLMFATSKKRYLEKGMLVHRADGAIVKNRGFSAGRNANSAEGVFIKLMAKFAGGGGWFAMHPHVIAAGGGVEPKL